MMLRADRNVEFGLGLIGIGKPWGFANPEVPDERQALTLLERALALGVRDTSPSYGVSEERLGRFLAALSSEERSQVRVATKFGEHWDTVKAEPFVNHSLDALKRSLDGSIERLGRIDLLQLHKTTAQRPGVFPGAGDHGRRGLQRSAISPTTPPSRHLRASWTSRLGYEG